MWKVQYQIDNQWNIVAKSQGGRIDGGIFECGGEQQSPVIAESIRVIAYSDNTNDHVSIHLRARGGVSSSTNDVSTTPKATLIQYIGGGLITSIEPSQADDRGLIYPNSTQGLLHLAEATTWSLLSTGGQAPAEGSGNVIDLSYLISGLYFIKTTHGSYKVIKK